MWISIFNIIGMFLQGLKNIMGYTNELKAFDVVAIGHFGGYPIFVL